MNGARHRVSELDFLIAHRVPAKQRHTRFAQHREAAREHRANHVARHVFRGKRRDRERRQRRAAHRVDIAQRIRAAICP